MEVKSGRIKKPPIPRMMASPAQESQVEVGMPMSIIACTSPLTTIAILLPLPPHGTPDHPKASITSSCFWLPRLQLIATFPPPISSFSYILHVPSRQFSQRAHLQARTGPPIMILGSYAASLPAYRRYGWPINPRKGDPLQHTPTRMVHSHFLLQMNPRVQSRGSMNTHKSLMQYFSSLFIMLLKGNYIARCDFTAETCEESIISPQSVYSPTICSEGKW